MSVSSLYCFNMTNCLTHIKKVEMYKSPDLNKIKNNINSWDMHKNSIPFRINGTSNLFEREIWDTKFWNLHCSTLGVFLYICI